MKRMKISLSGADYIVSSQDDELSRYDKRITQPILSLIGEAAHNGQRGNALA
jgi:hypothetical protein